jgi:hypothetical protein
MADYKVPAQPLVVAPQYLQTPKDDQGKVDLAIAKMNELLRVQKQVDTAIEKMAPGADRDRLIALRKENRGFIFQQVILPAWEKIRAWTGAGATAAPMSGEAEPYDGGFGIVPLIPVAVIAASAAILGYVGTNLYTEYKILNDPAISSTQKLEFLQTRSLGGTLAQLKWFALAGLIGYGIYFASKNPQLTSKLFGGGKTA